MVAFDVETTGVDTEEARIVSAAAARVGGGERTEWRTWLVNPGVPIPLEAAEVHGITDEVAAGGMEPAVAVEELLEALSGRAGGALVAFNARFDLTVLDREARRYGLSPLSERVEPLHVVDPLLIDKWLDRYRKGSRKLDAMCAHYGASLDGAHDAAADAIAAARVAWAIGAKGRVIRRVRSGQEQHELQQLEELWELVRHDVAALHFEQIGWAYEQAVGLAAYFREKGEHESADGVQTDWPVVAVRSTG